MNFLKDEAGQGAAEYILLFGGVIAIAALVIYKSYFTKDSTLNSDSDMLNARSSADVANK